MKFKHIALTLTLSLLLAGCGGLPAKLTDGKKDKAKAADVHVRLGWSYLQRGQYDVARTETKRALELDPRSARAHHVHGLLMIQLGDVEEANRSLRLATRYGPDNLDAKQDYASFLCEQDRLDAGFKIYQSVLDNPQNRERQVTLTRAGLCLLRKKENEQAERFFRQALETDPSIPEALSAMSQLAYNTGEYLKARAYLERYHSVGPETAQTLAWGVLIESRLGDETAASDYGSRLKTVFPQSRQARQLARNGRLDSTSTAPE